MFTTRLAAERGQSDFGWLDSRHSFSFGHYYDPRFMGFGALRVINDDRVRPGAGFGMHPHRDMEILSWVLTGALEHKDSTGSGGIIRAGELQRMSAGTGVTHSEYNASDTEPVHFLQIWLQPDTPGLQPEYEQTAFAPAKLQDSLLLIASTDGRDGSVPVHQDVRLYAGRLAAGAEVSHVAVQGRRLWLQVAQGSVSVVDGPDLQAGDATAWAEPGQVTIHAHEPSEILLFDLAA